MTRPHVAQSSHACVTWRQCIRHGEREAQRTYVTLSGRGRVSRRHLPGAEGGTLCHPEASVEPADPDHNGAVCKTCERIEGSK